MSPDPRAHERAGRGVRNFDSAAWDREAKRRVIWHSRQIQAEDGIRDAQESRGLGDVYKRQLSNTPQIMWCCSGRPALFFAVVAFVVYRRRRVIILRGAVYDGRIGQAF